MMRGSEDVVGWVLVLVVMLFMFVLAHGIARLWHLYIEQAVCG